MKIIATVIPTKLGKCEPNFFARVYRDTDWNEYRVKFFRQGAHMVAADYHTDDRQDALDTAKATVDGLSDPVMI